MEVWWCSGGVVVQWRCGAVVEVRWYSVGVVV